MSKVVCTSPINIVVIDPEGRRRTAELAVGEPGPLRVGRAPENDIQLISPYISRRHAEIWPDERGVVFVDLSSTSGSYIEGGRVNKVILRVGDEAYLGSPDGLRLSVELPEEERSGEEDDRHQTEVLRVADLESSAYLTSTGRLFAPPSPAPSAEADASMRKTEQRLIGLITLTSELLDVSDTGDMSARLLRKVFELLSVERGMILLNVEGELLPHAWRGPKEDEIVLATSDAGPKPLDPELEPTESSRPPTPFNPIRTVTRRVFDEGVGLLSLDAGSDQRLEGSQSVVLQSVRSIMCAPIASASEVYGVIYVDTHETIDENDEDHLDWLVAVAHQAGMVMEKLLALEQRERMTESLMRALAASIDARDGLTAGHSARVAHYSVGIARTLGLGVQDQYAIYYAALLHDYGKIGIDDAVLKKPARLTPEEFDHIKLHPKFTFDILSKIEFPPELAELPMMAASHHERWDGTGYPWGLKEEAVPIAGRIIAIADVYDSLTRKRHYRDPMPLDEVLSYLEEGRASHFDPTVLDAFFSYQREELDGKERRRAAKKSTLGSTTAPRKVQGRHSSDDIVERGEALQETDPSKPRTELPEENTASFISGSDEQDELKPRADRS